MEQTPSAGADPRPTPDEPTGPGRPRIVVLGNPKAGRSRHGAAAQDVVRALTALGADVIPLTGGDPSHSLTRLRSLVGAGVDAVVAVGGDGTVHLALQALAGSDTALGIVPAGSGNDMARHWGLPRDPKQAADAVMAALAGPPVRVDLARITAPGLAEPRWFGAVMSAGFDSAVTEVANELTFPPGELKYIRALFQLLPKFTPLTIRLDLDGSASEIPATMVAIGNTSSYGGGMKVAPDASDADGLIDVVVVGNAGRMELVRAFPSIYKGTHTAHPKVTARQGRRLTITADPGMGAVAYADGEHVVDLPADGPPLVVEAVPGALRVLRAG